MDTYHEDLIRVLEEITLHHMQELDRNFNNWLLNGSIKNSNQFFWWKYHRERVTFIRSELDRLAEKYK